MCKRFDWNSSISIHSKYVICYSFEICDLCFHLRKNKAAYSKYNQRMDSINTKKGNITAFEFRAQPILTLRIRLAFGWWLYMLIPHWLVLMWLIDMDFYNNRDENCYAIQYNDGSQLMQWSNKTVSWSRSIQLQNYHWEYNAFQWSFHLDFIESLAWYYPLIGYYQSIILSIIYH